MLLTVDNDNTSRYVPTPFLMDLCIVQRLLVWLHANDFSMVKHLIDTIVSSESADSKWFTIKTYGSRAENLVSNVQFDNNVCE